MFDGVKGQFVKACGDGVDPRTIPPHIVAYYDEAVRMFTKFGHFSGVEDVPHNDWPLICLMAELKMKADRLEARVMALEYKDTPTLSPFVADEDDPTVRRIDGRSREARAARQAQSVGA